MWWKWVVCSLVIAQAADARRVVLQETDRIREHFGLTAYGRSSRVQSRLKELRIAVIGNGFGDLSTLREDLPESQFTLVTQYDPNLIERFGLGSPDSHLPMDGTDHGRTMAILTSSLTWDGPRFFLLNGNGLTNFSRAVRYCIENKIHIILFSQNWEYGGNFDGRGFINRIVSEATAQGILWINAAGNYGGNVYNGQVRDLRPLRIRSRLERNPVRIVLSWNSYSETESAGTDKDLDLFVYDENNRLLGKSELRQVLGRPGQERKDGETHIPREIVDVALPKNVSGHHRIEVKVHSGNFHAADRARVTVLPLRPEGAMSREERSIEFTDASNEREIMVPADHPEVITVGDLSDISSIGPTESVNLEQKPDLLLDMSEAMLSDGNGSQGTSNAAAYFAGIAAVLLAQNPGLTREALIELGTDFQKVPLSEVREKFGALYSEFVRYLNEEPLLAVRHRDGHYGLGIRRDPTELPRLFPPVANLVERRNHLEYYIFFEQTRGSAPRLRTMVRDRSRHRLPWEIHNSASELFIEVRRADTSERAQRISSVPVWKTPSP